MREKKKRRDRNGKKVGFRVNVWGATKNEKERGQEEEKNTKWSMMRMSTINAPFARTYRGLDGRDWVKKCGC